MDYLNVYNQLIKRSQSDFRQKGGDIYYEQHHIIPRCLGGTDKSENLVLLTAREHFIAHKLLCEIYPNNQKIYYAFWAMMNLNNKHQSRNFIISSRDYNIARLKFIELVKHPKSEIHKLNLKRSWTTERKRLESEKKSGKKMIYKNGVSPRLGTRVSEEKILRGKNHPMWGKSHTTETKKKISKSLSGRVHTTETKKKMSESAKNKPYIICPHCLLQSRSKSNMNRYHFDNCKKKGINHGRL